MEYKDETIDITTADCENVDSYKTLATYQDIILYYTEDENSYITSYIIKRLLDNEKEYEYAICSESKFVIKQCNVNNGNCNCHEVIKNDRPKEITQCNSLQLESVMNCLVDGISKEIQIKDYFSLMTQTKIEDYYLMEYYCNNEIYYRGNYKNNSKKLSVSSILLLLTFILL